MKPIEIREFISNDLDRCRDILYSVQLNDFTWVNRTKVKLDDFDRITEGEKVFVACIEERVVGFMAVWEIDYFLHSLYIDQEYRHIGIGNEMITFLLNYYSHPITLKCVKENSKALSFYLSLGWVIHKEESGPDGPYYLIGSHPL
jgi:ribosomal protein S18 acetylase RimI-like enzyme